MLEDSLNGPHPAFLQPPTPATHAVYVASTTAAPQPPAQTANAARTASNPLLSNPPPTRLLCSPRP